MQLLLIYYIISLIYCMFKILNRYKESSLDGVIGITPGLDTIVIVLLCMILFPIDLFLTLRNYVKSKLR